MSCIYPAYSTPLFAASLAVTLSLLGCSNSSQNGGAGGSSSAAFGGGAAGGSNASTGGSGGASTSSANTAPSTGGNANTGGTTATRIPSGGTMGVGGSGGTETTSAIASGGSTTTSSSTTASGGVGGITASGLGGTKASSGIGGQGGSTSVQATGGLTATGTGTHTTGGIVGLGGAGPVGGTKGGGGVSATGGTSGVGQTTTSSNFKLTSTELADGATIPTDATCESTFASSQLPPLAWTGAPSGTKSFAMAFVDETLIGATPPSANGFHSAMWNIPATVTSLPQGLPAGSPPAGVAGLEAVKQKKAPSGEAWLGPCPNYPNTTRTKTDTYQFRLYALNVETLPSNTSSMSIQQIYNYLEALPPLGVAILTGTSNAAATQLK